MPPGKRDLASTEGGLLEREQQWLSVLESYQLASEAQDYLADVRARQARLSPITRGSSALIRHASLSELLGVLVSAAVEHSDGKAKAAFYMADLAGAELHHVIGMSESYARHVNGFVIGEQSLACGLAVAQRKAVITPDVTGDLRWKPWLWLAEEGGYRACWSFPVEMRGKVLGSLALYYNERREPTPRDIELASVLARTGATIIERYRHTGIRVG